MEPKEKLNLQLSVKTVWWVSIGLYIAFVVSAVLLLVLDEMVLAGVLTFIVFAIVIFNRACWKCPSCKKHLGRFSRVRKCPHCGEEWDM